MPEGVTTGWLGETHVPYRQTDDTLQNLRVQMMPPYLPGIRVHATLTGREYILPAPFASCVGIFLRQRMWKINLPKAFLQVFRM